MPNCEVCGLYLPIVDGFRCGELSTCIANLKADIECYEGMKEGVAVRIADLEAEIKRLRTALEAIVTHQEFIGGGLAVLSTVRKIAQLALGAEAAENSP